MAHPSLPGPRGPALPPWGTYCLRGRTKGFVRGGGNVAQAHWAGLTSPTGTLTASSFQGLGLSSLEELED